MTIEKILRIKKSSEFRNIGKSNQKFYSKTIILLCKATPKIYLQNEIDGKNAKDFCRVGYTVSKKIGNAVERNLAKRRLRELFCKLSKNYVKNHHDYSLIARSEIANVDFEKIAKDLEFCLKNIHKNLTK